MANIMELAKAAYPVNDDDWGTERQIDAENAFFAAVEQLMSPELFESLETYALKATAEERISFALELLNVAR